MCSRVLVGDGSENTIIALERVSRALATANIVSNTKPSLDLKTEMRNSRMVGKPEVSTGHLLGLSPYEAIMRTRVQ